MYILIFCILGVAPLVDWSPDTIISEGYTSYPNQHNIVCNGTGDIYSVWYKWGGGGRAYSVWFNSYIDSYWSTAQELSDISYRVFDSYPSVAMYADNIYCAWTRGSGYSEIVLRRAINGNWEDTVIVISSSSNYSYAPSMACDFNGIVHIVYEKGYEICYRKLDADFLSDEVVLSSSGIYASYPAIACYQNNIFVVWEDIRDGNFELYFKMWNGSQWSGDARITNSSLASIFPSICVDSTGVLHIVWQEESSSGYKIFYTSYSSGAFSSPILIVDSQGEAITPSIAASNDRLHLVWSDSRAGDWEIYYKIKNDWGDDIRLTNSPGISAGPSICANNSGNVYLLFWDTRVSPAKIYFKKGTISKDEENTHLELAISPNPFHNKTVIEFRVKSSELKDLQLQIYDLSGRVVKTFNSINPINSIVWDGKSDDGTLLNSGIYFIKVVGQGFSLANPPRKVVFIR